MYNSAGSQRKEALVELSEVLLNHAPLCLIHKSKQTQSLILAGCQEKPRRRCYTGQSYEKEALSTQITNKICYGKGRTNQVQQGILESVQGGIRTRPSPIFYTLQQSGVL